MEDTQYIGKTCPFCKTKFVTGDSIHVCAACSTPHHTECWEENEGCSTYGCTGRSLAPAGIGRTDACVNCGAVLEEGYLFCQICGTPRQVQTVRQDVCQNCGAALSEEYLFCEKCGTPRQTQTVRQDVCQSCGAVLSEEYLFCEKCGTPRQTQAARQNVCEACGAVLEEGFDFCHKCGSRIQHSSALPSANTMGSTAPLSAASVYAPTAPVAVAQPVIQATAPYYGQTHIGPQAVVASANSQGVEHCSGCGKLISAHLTSCPYCGRYKVYEKITASEISNKWVWAYAVVPIVVRMLFKSILGGWLWVILTALEVTFVLLDHKELRKYKNPPGAWIWWGLFVIPVYLFMRASKIDGKYGYAITWCVLLAASVFI